MEALKSAWLLDTQRRNVALADVASSLKGNQAKMFAFAEEACAADVSSDYDLAVSALDILKSTGATKANESVASLVQSLASCVFADVRSAAAASGLLTDVMALQILKEGQDDQRKATLKAKAAGLYNFAYDTDVERACDSPFGEKSQIWKVTLGADPVCLFKEKRPSADTMLALVDTLPIETLATLLQEMDHIAHAKWLQKYIRRIEDKYPPQGKQLNERITKLTEMLLYNSEVWIGHARGNASKIIRYLFRR